MIFAFMSISLWAKWPYWIYIAYIRLFGTGKCRFIQVLYLGKSSPYKGDSARISKVTLDNPTSTCFPRVDG